jgi:citrate lyase subunit beta/citryl-CoA lyase
MGECHDRQGELTMAIDVAPARSVLFVPANREERMRKALTLGADAVIFDLESAIPRGEAERARGMVRDIVGGHRGRPTTVVRISAVDTDEFRGDLEAALQPTLGAIMLPQVVSADDVRRADEAMSEVESAIGREVGSTILWPLVETANSVRTAYDIASASPRVAYMGGATSRGGDLARSVGYRFTATGEETMYIRSKVLIDVRSAGVANPISGLWGDIEDKDGLRRLALQNRDIGYEGMLVIHPSHIDVVNEVFTPSTAEIEEWQRIVEAMEEAERDGLGAIRLDGRLVDVAHVKTAEQELARVRRLGVI